jgi:hypothetical protein
MLKKEITIYSGDPRDYEVCEFLSDHLEYSFENNHFLTLDSVEKDIITYIKGVGYNVVCEKDTFYSTITLNATHTGYSSPFVDNFDISQKAIGISMIQRQSLTFTVKISY